MNPSQTRLPEDLSPLAHPSAPGHPAGKQLTVTLLFNNNSNNHHSTFGKKEGKKKQEVKNTEKEKKRKGKEGI